MGEPSTPNLPELTGEPAALPVGRRGSDRAAAVIWDWKREGSTDTAVHTSRLRTRGCLQGAVGLAIAGGIHALGHPTLALIVAAIGSFTLLSALVSPGGIYASIERGLQVFARRVGQVVGWIVLLPIYFGFFLPFGLLFRRGARDPMRRRFEADVGSYWNVRQPDEDVVQRHRSQF